MSLSRPILEARHFFINIYVSFKLIICTFLISFRLVMAPVELTSLTSLRVSKYQIPAHSLIPNTSIQQRPVLIYHSCFPPQVSASEIEDHLHSVGVIVPQWRYTLHNTTHFHTTTHEVLCVSMGAAKLCFGGENNPGRIEVDVKRGDVMILPAGVGHRLLEDQDGDFEMVGAYPKGNKWDVCYGRPEEESKLHSMANLGWFQSDPLYGDEGPCLE